MRLISTRLVVAVEDGKGKRVEGEEGRPLDL